MMEPKVQNCIFCVFLYSFLQHYVAEDMLTLVSIQKHIKTETD